MSKAATSIINPNEFHQQMLEISREPDVEGRHSEADRLLCQVLRQLGYGTGVDVFESMKKWHA